MHVAIITIGAFGHVLPTLPYLKELTSRGVRVTYFSSENFRQTITDRGAEFVPFETNLTNQGKPADDIGKNLIAELPLRFLSEADYVASQILPILKEDKPDVIVHDQLAIAGRLVAKVLGLPTIQFYTSFAANEHFSVARNFPPVPANDPARLAADQLAVKISAEYGIKHLGMFEIFEDKGDLNISVLQRKFHPAGDTFDNSFIFTGAQIAPRDNSGTWQPPSGDRPLVYASLGTLFNDQPEFYKMLFAAVKDLPINLVTAIGNSVKAESLGSIPPNVTTGAYLPQLDILEKASLFVTHAGTGSVMESIYYGVPMIGIPQMPEQIFTAMQLEKLGLGKAILDKEHLSAELLHDMIRAVLNEPLYRKIADEFKADMRNSGGASLTAQSIIDFVSRMQQNL